MNKLPYSLFFLYVLLHSRHLISPERAVLSYSNLSLAAMRVALISHEQHTAKSIIKIKQHIIQ